MAPSASTSAPTRLSAWRLALAVVIAHLSIVVALPHAPSPLGFWYTYAALHLSDPHAYLSFEPFQLGLAAVGAGILVTLIAPLWPTASGSALALAAGAVVQLVPVAMLYMEMWREHGVQAITVAASLPFAFSLLLLAYRAFRSVRGTGEGP